MSKEHNEVVSKKLISYNEETNISMCLVPECHTIFIGKQKLAIQRHYRIAHGIDIEVYGNNNEDVLDIHNINIIRNNAHVEDSNTNELINYSTDNTKYKVKSNNIAQTYVEYCKETNVSKCLIKHCERAMSGCRTGNIKRHYDKVHNFIIVHEKIRAMNKELTLYYNNVAFGDSTFYEEELFDASDHHSNTIINFEQYIDYDTLTNKSLCKVQGCKTYLQGRKAFNIKRHYGVVHNYDIESNGAKTYDSKQFKNSNSPFQNTSTISVEDLVAYDIKSGSYQCLFINCNQILEKQLPTLKRHYHEIHKIIIAKFSDNIPHSIYRKRKPRDPFESVFSREEEEFADESDSIFIKNEVLSDDDYPHCSKRPKCIANNLKPHANKTEYTSEDIEGKVAITMTKPSFFKLCLDLVIERDFNINFFDDEKHFKKLLLPFEQVFDCHVNSSLIESLMITANDLVIAGLKQKFNKKIVCLELHIVNYGKQFYLIYNVRFLNEQIICNKIIGFLPISKASTEVPQIFEYLKKFNIDKQQVYMTTITAALQNDEEINIICNNLCKHNPNIKKHPIYYIQTTLRSFVQKYSEDIKRWEKLVNCDCNLNMDVFNNLRELDKYIEKFSRADIDMEPQSRNIKSFLKTLQILRNFIEKLTEEHYVAGDFYRDWLCCELELKGEVTKSKNEYAGDLYEDMSASKNTLMEYNELMAALYLDTRFNFLGSRLLSDAGKTKGKMFLCIIWEKFNKFIKSASSSNDLILSNQDYNDDSDEDEYAVLNHHINEIMSVKSTVCIHDMITNCIPSKRKPLSLDILKYWHCRRQDMTEINELTKIVFTFPCSQYISISLQNNFLSSDKGAVKFDKFLIKNNQNILENSMDLLLENLERVL